ncbi:MAG: glycosyltransferase family 39 protein [Patescibacteria group bacterium]
MLLEKTRRLLEFLFSAERNKQVRIFLIVLFSLLFFVTRLPGLKTDVISPDAVNWHYRSEQFVVGLKYQQFDKTYQHYHPGVILMWVTGIPIELYKQITNDTVYNNSNFETFDLIAKTSLVLVQFVLLILILCILPKIIGFYKTFLTVVFFTFEPFFVGNSRLYHLDVLTTLLLLLSLIFAFLGLKKEKIVYQILAGFFLALSFLTKSVSVGAVLFVLFYAISYFIFSKQPKRIFKYCMVTFLSFVFFTFLLFPALWVKPVYYLSFIFSESIRVGVRKGHSQILLGEVTKDPGFWFYPLVILVKASPFLIIGFIAGLITSLKKVGEILKDTKSKFLNFGLYLAVFNLGYVAAMIYPAKKIDRYMIVIYPFMALLAVIGYSRILSLCRTKRTKILFWLSISAFSVVFWIYPLIKLYPYYFAYTSPLVGSSENANRIVVQKAFGVGIHELRDFILKRYGGQPKLGFYDVKPMGAIYPHSRIFYVKTYGPSNYDLLVLPMNEDMPSNVLNDKNYYVEKDSSLIINGLEYWRIYVTKKK